MRRNFRIALLYTVATTILFGLVYPAVVTGVAQLFFKDKANGQLVYAKGTGELVGSHLIGQPFSAPQYFHSRPSTAGYDAKNSGGSNLGPTSQKLIDRIQADAAAAQVDRPGVDVPIDLITASGSGLDPDITPAAAEYQVGRVAKQRHLEEGVVRQMISRHTLGRQLGFLGEARVNVLDLNMELDGVVAGR